MYALEVSRPVERIFGKLVKKDPAQFEAIQKKLPEILAEPHHFKPLRAPFHGVRRVHVHGSFMLLFRIDEARKVVILTEYDHHDAVYRR